MGYALAAEAHYRGADVVLISGPSSGRIPLKLLIIAEDASENTKNKMAGEAGSQGLPYKVYGYSDELSHTAGTSGRMVFGITDDNFAKVITEQITES